VSPERPDADRPDEESWLPDDLDAIVIPDDLSGLDKLLGRPDPDSPPAPPVPETVDTDEPVTVALLLTQVVAAEHLAALCALVGVGADAVASSVGSVAVLTDPAAGAAAAATISRAMPGTEVVLFERRDGSITGAVWSRGVRGDEVAPGLVLAEGPAVLEDLLLGDATAADIDGTVPSAGISRFRALFLLSRRKR